MSNARKKFGTTKSPIKATRLLGRPMPYFQGQGTDGHSLLVINDVDGTFSAVNVYNGNLGRGVTPKYLPLPAKGDAKWKDWAGRGYVEYDMAKFDVVEAIEAPVTEEAAV